MENNQQSTRESINVSSDRRIKNKPVKQRNYFFLLLVIFLSFYVGVAWGKTRSNYAENPSARVADFVKRLADPKDVLRGTEKNKPEKVDFSIFWDAWREIDKKYVDEEKLDPQKMVYGAIKGMVQALGDPYSSFMDPEETKEFDINIEGSFEGIGAELGMKDDVLTVIAPIEGMPAEKAGLRAGDKILKINGEMTTDMAIDEAVKKIRGPKGTVVTLTIVRNGDSKTQEIKITRAKIELRSVYYEKKEGNIAYIRISQFTEDTAKEFNKETTKAIADGCQGIVLDVRNNPGGFLSVAVEIASKFIPKGEIVVWEQGRDGSRNAFKAIGGDSLSEMPVVVLINEGSASASEILAGALRDVKHVKLIGEKSFGKGSVQQLENLKDNSSLRITIAKWLTPSGQSIHEVGLAPDIEIKLTEQDIKNKKDTQLEGALIELKRQLKDN